tara:strand:- start:1074 stop:1256 length:183 start_codon:yes stop_codon:yes gene_type:complete
MIIVEKKKGVVLPPEFYQQRNTIIHYLITETQLDKRQQRKQVFAKLGYRHKFKFVNQITR